MSTTHPPMYICTAHSCVHVYMCTARPHVYMCTARPHVFTIYHLDIALGIFSAAGEKAQRLRIFSALLSDSL